MAGGGANADMAALWNGPSGDHWVAYDDQHDRALARWGDAVLAAAAPAGDDRVLDVGCGTGGVTRAAARRAPGGTALGVDIGAPMIERARARTAVEGPPNARFELADAQTHPFAPGSVDLVVSRFGTMFFDDPDAASANLARAAVPGGRLAFACWQGLFENEWVFTPAAALATHVGLPDIPPDAPGPFSLAEPDRVRTLLGAAGFTGIELDEVAGPMFLGDSAEAAATFLEGSPTTTRLLEGKDPDLVARALAAMRATVDDLADPDGLSLPAKAWVVTASRAG